MKEHNDRNWFAANRDRFTADVEEPLLAFIGDFAPRLRGGGAYHVDRPALTRIRQRIVDLPQEWSAARAGLEIHGEQLKRAPAGFPSADGHIEDLKRTNLYVLTQFTEGDVVAGGFLDRFTEACVQAAPVLEFQTKALGLRWK